VLKVSNFVETTGFEHAALFDGCTYYWDVIAKLDSFINTVLHPGIIGVVHPMTHIEGAVFIDDGSVVEIGSHIVGPVWIGRNCRIRAGSYIQSNVIMGDNVDFGHNCNAYRCVIMDNAKVFPMCFLGASIIGNNTSMQAGCILNGLTISRDEIVVRVSGHEYNTGLKNLGAIIGHDCRLGGHVTTAPGTMLGTYSTIHDNVFLSGFYGHKTILKAEHDR
jgi:UDP-N-acetylglucosamine diphosphorylase / glucose-1-phosphate thymidylyltransferase / UDP-N-acetylgalactosamine diphosphorylase / glucosamine-1-phosphate N-acetyltransferase / galactosamine-1-phosphate N-acetyltransferase